MNDTLFSLTLAHQLDSNKQSIRACCMAYFNGDLEGDFNKVTAYVYINNSWHFEPITLKYSLTIRV